jgi:hypothetical protein
MSLDDIVDLVNDLKKIPNRTTGMKVFVLDTETNLGITYRSKKHENWRQMSRSSLITVKRYSVISIGSLLNLIENLVYRQLFSYAILGFALSEATGLFALMMSFLLLYS